MLRLFPYRPLVVIALFLQLAACASSPVRTSLAKPVPADRVVGSVTATSKNPASVTVVRDRGFQGAGVTILLKVDGKEIARFYPSEKIDFKIDPGSHIFAVKSWDSSFVESETILKADERAFYRITVGNGIAVQKSSEISD